jgi:hypothetical protein
MVHATRLDMELLCLLPSVLSHPEVGFNPMSGDGVDIG